MRCAAPGEHRAGGAVPQLHRAGGLQGGGVARFRVSAVSVGPDGPCALPMCFMVDQLGKFP